MKKAVLKGSEKQIAWAEDIRDGYIALMEGANNGSIPTESAKVYVKEMFERFGDYDTAYDLKKIWMTSPCDEKAVQTAKFTDAMKLASKEFEAVIAGESWYDTTSARWWINHRM